MTGVRLRDPSDWPPPTAVAAHLAPEFVMRLSWPLPTVDLSRTMASVWLPKARFA